MQAKLFNTYTCTSCPAALETSSEMTTSTTSWSALMLILESHELYASFFSLFLY